MDTVLPEALEYDVTLVASVDLLLRTLRVENDKLDAPEYDGGLVWKLHTGADTGDSLYVGVRGGVGSLVWSTRDQSYVPHIGLNEDFVSYRDIKGYDAPMPPRSEVSIDTVLSVVADYYASQVQPASIQWMVEPEPPRLPGETDDYMDGSWVPG